MKRDKRFYGWSICEQMEKKVPSNKTLKNIYIQKSIVAVSVSVFIF